MTHLSKHVSFHCHTASCSGFIVFISPSSFTDEVMDEILSQLLGLGGELVCKRKATNYYTITYLSLACGLLYIKICFSLDQLRIIQ